MYKPSARRRMWRCRIFGSRCHFRRTAGIWTKNRRTRSANP